MVKLLLPTHQYAGPYPFPQNEREDLLQRMYKSRSLIVGAEQMELSELRDLVQAQEGKTKEGHYEKKIPQHTGAIKGTADYIQAQGALREYTAWRRKKAQAEGLVPKNN